MAGCWFCNDGRPSKLSNFTAQLKKSLGSKSSPVFMGTRYTTTYNVTEVAVPRCIECKKMHDRKAKLYRIYALLLIILAVALFIYFYSEIDAYLDPMLPYIEETYGESVLFLCMAGACVLGALYSLPCRQSLLTYMLGFFVEKNIERPDP